MRLALRFAQEHRPITFDAAARERWIEIYDKCPRPGPDWPAPRPPAPKHTPSAWPLIYALLDLSEHIGLEHLDAALAVWRYSAASARWIFGDALGDPTADELCGRPPSNAPPA